MSVANRLLLIANLVLFAALGWLILSQGLPLRPSAGWEYKDLISALLTVVTIILAFIGLVVGIAAVWGWQTISKGAAREAAKVSAEQTDAHLQSESFQGALKVLIAEQLEKMKKAEVQAEVIVDPGRDAPAGPPAADEPWQDE